MKVQIFPKVYGFFVRIYAFLMYKKNISGLGGYVVISRNRSSMYINLLSLFVFKIIFIEVV